eukprot:8878937-Alexandrium_andersonii.AAC.1
MTDCSTVAPTRRNRRYQGRPGNTFRVDGSRAPRSGAGTRRATRQSRARHQDRAPRCGDAARCRQSR